MTSYNKLNGYYTNENPHLLNDILRNEWNYKNLVVTDWGGSNSRIEGLKCGNALEMPTNNGETDLEIINAIKKKKLSVKTINKDSSKPTIEIEKHGSYYYKETCPICGCIFNFDPHSLGFSYNNIGKENESRTEWIYCPECAYKFEWNEGYHKKLNY